MGGKAEVSAGELVDEGCSLGGEPPEARARSAGGLYLAPMPCSASSSLALAETEPVSGQLDATMEMEMQGAKTGREDTPFCVRSRGGGRRGLASGHAREGVVVGGERHEAVRCWIRYYLMFFAERIAREQARRGER